MNCANCSAPLPGKSMICKHCGTLNDVDLRTLEESGGTAGASDRQCPRCNLLMDQVMLKASGKVRIERCKKCLGLFFDPEELERVLDNAVADAKRVDHKRMQLLVEEEYRRIERKVGYISCPACNKKMHRRNYGAKSGVIVDSCREHGVWLDGGELSQLLKWCRAGGRIFDAQVRARDAEKALQRERSRERERKAREGDIPFSGHPSTYSGDSVLDDFLTAVIRELF